MRALMASTLVIAACGPAAFGEIDGHTLGEVGSAVAAYHQDGRGMYIVSDQPDLCDVFDLNPSDPAEGDYWVVSVTTLEAAERGLKHEAVGFAGVSEGGIVSEYVADEAYVTVRSQDEEVAAGFIQVFFGDDRIQGSINAELCGTSALFIGSE